MACETGRYSRGADVYIRARPSGAIDFTACPGTTQRLDASTCVDPAATHFDTVLYVRPNGGVDLARDDDAAASSCMPRAERPSQADGSILSGVAVRGPGLFWLVVDVFSTECGGEKLATNLR